MSNRRRLGQGGRSTSAPHLTQSVQQHSIPNPSVRKPGRIWGARTWSPVTSLHQRGVIWS